MENQETLEPIFEVTDEKSPFFEMRGTIVKQEDGFTTFAFLEEYHHLLADNEKIITLPLIQLVRV